MEKFDLVILGSGSTAFAAALRAAELGKTAAMTESRSLGGTCVNRGCLPSKNLIEAAKIFHESRHPRYPGLQPAEMGLDFGALIAQKDEVVYDYRDRKYQSIITDSEKIKVFTGPARFTGPKEVVVGNVRMTADRFLIATGSRPFIPEIPGLADTPFMTSDLLTSGEAIELRELPESLICIGAGYISLELGQMFARFGTAVTILDRGENILPRYEPEISQSVTGVFREEGIILLTNARVVNVMGNERAVTVTIDIKGRQRKLSAARLMVATGRGPNTDALDLGNAGVAVDEHGFVRVNNELRTSMEHIFAAGDVVGAHAGSQMATPVGAQDGGIAAGNALNGDGRQVDHRVVPRAIFINPQVGTVGLTDEEANRRGHQCVCRTVPMTLVPRAGAVRDTRGAIKMVVDRSTRKVLGVSMHALNAAEAIHEAALGLRLGATVDDFAAMLHVYPTMSEALKIVALSFTKNVAKLSCCAE